MNNAENKTGHISLSWWHSLMYSTSALLLFCGIPATVVLAFTLPLDSRNGLERSDGFTFGACMIGAELLIAGILHFVAERLFKRRLRTHTEPNDDAKGKAQEPVFARDKRTDLCRMHKLGATPMYHHSNDRTVPKRAASYHKNIDGPFYVSDQCIICALPLETAPENFAWDCPTGCDDCPNSCYIKKQPGNDAELNNMIEAMLGSEVENIRYCGTDTEVLRRLRKAGSARLCDAL